MNNDWVMDKVKKLDPYVELRYVYDTGIITGLKKLSELAKEVGWETALQNPEVVRIGDWVYENCKDPS